MAKASPIIVFKIGGEILRDETLLAAAIGEITRIKKRKPKARLILVHGAGPQLDERFRNAGVPIEKIGGKRRSTKKGMAVIWNFIPDETKRIAEMLKGTGMKAEAIDFPLTTLARIGDKRLGFVGTPIGVNLKQLRRIIRKGTIPIVSICGVTKQKQIVNVNADEVAAAIAAAMKADMLEFKTKTPGILRKGKTIGRITPKRIDQLIAEGVVDGGMLVKARAAKTAVEHGVGQARISGLGQNKRGTTVRRRRR